MRELEILEVADLNDTASFKDRYIKISSLVKIDTPLVPVDKTIWFHNCKIVLNIFNVEFQKELIFDNCELDFSVTSCLFKSSVSINSRVPDGVEKDVRISLQKSRFEDSVFVDAGEVKEVVVNRCSFENRFDLEYSLIRNLKFRKSVFHGEFYINRFNQSKQYIMKSMFSECEFHDYSVANFYFNKFKEPVSIDYVGCTFNNVSRFLFCDSDVETGVCFSSSSFYNKNSYIVFEKYTGAFEIYNCDFTNRVYFSDRTTVDLKKITKLSSLLNFKITGSNFEKNCSLKLIRAKECVIQDCQGVNFSTDKCEFEQAGSSTFRVLKRSSIENHIIDDYLLYKKREYDSVLGKWLVLTQEFWILILNKCSNNYGASPLRAFCFSLLVIPLFFLLVFVGDDNLEFSFSLEGFSYIYNNYIVELPKFFNPTQRLGSLNLLSNIGFSGFIELIIKMVLFYSIYQFTSSFRKYNS